MKALHKPEVVKFRGVAEVLTNPFIFRGQVSMAGYEWLKGSDGKPRLVPQRVPGVGFRPCEPHPGLFREFAELTPTKVSIQEFANRYGDLFNRYAPEQCAEREDGTVVFGASLGTWTQEIGDMRVLLGLWESVKNQAVAELKRIIRRTEKELCYVIETPRGKANVTLAHADIPGSGLSRFDPDDVVLPARCALQLEVNKRIAETPTIPRLSWTPDVHKSGDFIAPKFQRIIFEPSNLVAAMWMQFAQDMTGQFGLKKCECGCGRYFQVGPGAFKSHKTTFDAACRKRKSRPGKN